MESKLIQIGNSRGIRIPKGLIDQYELSEGIEIKAEPDGIKIVKKMTKRKPREGWAEMFAAGGPMTEDDMIGE